MPILLQTKSHRKKEHLSSFYKPDHDGSILKVRSDGPVRFKYPAQDYMKNCLNDRHFISAFGKQVIDFFRALLGRAGFMLFGALIGNPQIRKHFPLLVKQRNGCLGCQSLLIILLSGLFIGMVLGLQGYVVLVDFLLKQFGSVGGTFSFARIRACCYHTFICWSSWVCIDG